MTKVLRTHLMMDSLIVEHVLTQCLLQLRLLFNSIKLKMFLKSIAERLVERLVTQARMQLELPPLIMNNDYSGAAAQAFEFTAFQLIQLALDTISCTSYNLVAYDSDIPMLDMSYVVGGPAKAEISSKWNFDIMMLIQKCGDLVLIQELALAFAVKLFRV